jgi:hypothetical protein
MEKEQTAPMIIDLKRLPQESVKEKRKRSAGKKGQEPFTVFAVKNLRKIRKC